MREPLRPRQRRLVGLVRVLTLRKLTIILAVTIVFLFGVATLVAYYASREEHNEPPHTARVL